ncbi:MFS transporter [Apilactobacillus quenuiae]|uniref:MFS transporter n=1 Tax=Apilactobacillus quenuiae TaxID=2008377 RepID=UPI000D020509|nr:MFS transporter [Apilactobacillus quenuiae]
MLKKKLILPVLMLGSLLCMMDVSVMTILLPEIQNAFNQSLENLSWTINIYTIVFATLIIPFGRIAERIGQNKFVFIGLFVFGLGSLLSGYSPNLTFMLVARFIQSVGASAIIPTSMVIGISNFSVEKRHKVVGALAGSQGLAVAIGPSFGGWISQSWGWNWVFYVNVPIVILAMIIFAMILPMKNEKTSPIKIDYLGSILSMITLFSLSLGLIQGNKWGWSSVAIISLFIISAIAFITFITVEMKLEHPMIDMNLFKERNFNGAGLSLVSANFLLGGFVALIPTFLTKIHGESELQAALLITPYSIAVMFSTILSSLLIKRVNKKLFIFLGFISIAIGYYFFSIIPVDNNFKNLLIGAIILGIGYGMVAATANILAVANFKGSLLTESQSVANVLRQIGMVLAIAIFMTILSGNVQTAKTNTITYAHNQITKIDLPSDKKQTIRNKIDDKLDTKSNKVNNVNSSVSFTPVKVNADKRNKIINQIYLKKMAAINHQTIMPQNFKQILKANITKDVNRKIDAKVNKVNRNVNNLISDVKQHIKHQMNDAFLNVYRIMMWLPIISVLTIPIFKFRTKRK